MRIPFVDKVWRIRGTVALEEPLSPQQVFERLSHLFARSEVDFDRGGASMTYRKPNPAAQDRLATFSSGQFRFVDRAGRADLEYDASSPALLFTFLAPLLFVLFGQATVAIGAWEGAANADRAESQEEEDEEPRELHWIDQMLGAPAPEKPDEEEDENKEDDDHSPDLAYGLAAIFALIYLVGRILEPRLFLSVLRRTLRGETVQPEEITEQFLDPDTANH